MQEIKEGYKVTIHFEAKLETGEIILKTEDEKPLGITIGEGTIPPTIEKALIDMKEGESKTLTLEPNEAFGPRLDKLIIDLPRDGFTQDADIIVGSKVAINSSDGRKFTGIVLEIKDENITVDFNHPLAGKNLIFTVTVVSVE